MIASPIAPDLSTPVGRGPHGRRPITPRQVAFLGVGLIAASIISAVAWAIFVSPLGYTRYSLSDGDRTFTIHQAGTYVIYFEYPQESRPALPPALDVRVASLSGPTVHVHPVGVPGVDGAPDAYSVWHYEGRAVALLVADQAGTFLVSIDPTPAGQVDTSQQRIITEGTIALGREVSRSWLNSWFGFTVVVIVPLVAGLGVLVEAVRRRRNRATPN